MPVIVGIRFKKAGKVYYFSPKEIKFRKDEGAIVETVRGVEFGYVVIPNREVDDSEVVGQLKEVIRKATPKDIEQQEKNLLRKEEAFNICKEK